jgi:hypothetical protein
MKISWINKQSAEITRDQCKDTGMAILLILLLMTYYFKSKYFLLSAIGVLIINMTFPQVYRFVAVIWFGMARLLGTIMSKVLLTIVYLTVVTPVGLYRKIFCADSLKLRAFKKGSESVFEDRKHTFTGKDMLKPY